MRLTKWGVFWGFLVLWPAILWLAAFGVLLLANMGGCDISAKGPSPCDLYPLWALGYYAGFALIWVILTGVIWWIAEIIRARM